MPRAGRHRPARRAPPTHCEPVPDRLTIGGSGAIPEGLNDISQLTSTIEIEQARCSRDNRLECLTGPCLDLTQGSERSRVTDFPKCQQGVVVERPIIGDDWDQRIDGIDCSVITECFNYCAAKVPLSAVDVSKKSRLHGRSVVVRGQRPDEVGPNELRRLRIERGKQLGYHRRRRDLFEVLVRRGTNAIIRRIQRLLEQGEALWLLETVDEHDRPKLHVAVLVVPQRVEQHGQHCVGVRSA